jgi:cholesterol oxidase
MSERWDFIIIGSGFGGSVSALRLAEKGYRVLVIEKGKRFTKDDFAKTNWDLKRWMWRPELGLHGIFQMSFLRHVTIVHGVGVGGGSLVYANTLPTPTADFFHAPSWSHLADWQHELAPHYAAARRMLGATKYRGETAGDRIIRDIARDIGREQHFGTPDVAVFFGEPGREVDDPYFGGKGPRRTGCTECGACMTGCRVGAKNTLDQNYLYLAERLGAVVRPETEVTAVRPREGGGYVLETHSSIGRGGDARLEADQIVFAGGVMGTVPLLLAMRDDPAGLPKLSARVGDFVRTNSESLLAVVAPGQEEDFSRGIAITSILHTDEHSHLEPVRYGAGSGFFRTMAVPQAEGKTALGRIARTAGQLARRPLRWARALTTTDWSRSQQILLYMRTLEGTLELRLGKGLLTGFRRGLVSRLSPGSEPPTGSIPEALDLARRFAAKVGGVVMTMFTETLLGTPTTAHILGGACMGASSETGVIDSQHKVFGYDGLYVIDGSAVSANPGVNPSLTITALAERAMSFIPPKPVAAPSR